MFTSKNYFVCLISFFVFASSLSAAEKFVGTDGDDSRSGLSIGQHWLTLTHALRNLEPGDTLTILNGQYDIGNEFEGSNGVAHVRRTGFQRLDGFVNNVTTIRSQSRRGVFIRGNLTVEGSYIRIEGLILFGSSKNDEYGIKVDGSHHIDIVDNRIGWCGGGGISTAHTDSLRIIDNEVHNTGYRNENQHSAISIYQPIPFNDPENRHWGIEIRRNNCYNNTNFVPGQFGITDGNGIIIDDYLYEQTQYLRPWHRNVIGNNEEYPRRTLVEGNLCTYNGGVGVLCYLATNVSIKNNTCIGNNQYIFDQNWNFRNRGQICILDSFSMYMVNNAMQAKPVDAAQGFGGAPYAAAEMRGSDNLWENNLLHTEGNFNNLVNRLVVRNDSYTRRPNFADEANFDYRFINGFGLGITWGDGHVYEDLMGREVREGQRTDMGAIQF